MNYLFNKIMEWLGFERQVGATRVVWRRRRNRTETPDVQPRRQINKNPTNYLINDPTTPKLRKEIAIPTPPIKPVFYVKNFQGGGFANGTVEQQAANVYTSIANCLNWVNQHAGAIGSRHLPEKWAGTSQLMVLPQAGQELNAFYNRRTMQFFFFHDGQIQKTIYTADSADVVTHELGHAVLDTFRPDTWSAAALEVWAFHEAFADLVAMLSIMQHDEALELALAQTENDIRKPNVFSNIAEEIGQAIYRFSSPEAGRREHCLRSAINDFKYVNPGSLPKDAPHHMLAAESHSFGRIFLGAFYDILVGIYEKTLSEGHAPINALKHARDVLAQYAIKAVQNAPLNARFFESVAKTMLWADFSSHKQYHDLMKDVFMNRGIMKMELRMLSAPECDNDELIVRAQSSRVIKLSDHIVRAQSQEKNKLYDAEIEVPQEVVYLYDKDKNIYDVVGATDEETLSAAQDFVVFLNDNNLVGDDDSTPFELNEGKLQRTSFS